MVAIMKPRPSLDTLERLVGKHQGECSQPCDGCDLASEVVSLLRVLRVVTELPPEIPGRGLPDKSH
jgi:hypothetical protein